ncbi:MAG: hypothetical protein RBS39_09965 [Phycisphaerales bacterium]|jgi:Tfp pilus assembly PilM family ATPase|nr:hypothetical protein [Phycisphaerales bacterium]
MRHGLIGLDIGERRIRAVQLDASGARVHRTLCIVRPPVGGETLGDDECGRLADALDRLGFAGSRVSMVAPRAALCSSVLDLPPRATGAPIEKIAMGELAGRNRIDPERTELALWSTGEPGSRNGTERIIAVACAHEKAEAYVAPLERAGLRVEGMIPPTIALVQAMSVGRSHRIVLDLGWSSARVALVRDGLVLFDRAMQDAGLARVFERVGETLGARAEACEIAARRAGSPVERAINGEMEAFVRDLRRGVEEALGYGAKSARIDSPVEVCGGGAAIPALVARLQSAIGREVRPIEMVVSETTLEPAFASATGAARSEP